MKWEQGKISISSIGRGFHLITDDIIDQMPQISEYKIGLLHLFLMHTSASLTINENADPTVRDDLESHFNILVPEGQAYYKHTFEGSDDMPAHIKSSMIGNSLTVPVRNGDLVLGTWQGVYLCEHRDVTQNRKIVLTLCGEK
jgi:secondary thiamine-phosphate synthase enzyme